MKVLLTAIGTPGGIPSIRALKREGVTIVGADARDDVAARWMVDEFYRLPRGDDEAAYVAAVERVVEEAHPDAILPGSESELPALAWHKEEIEALGTKVLVPAAGTVAVAMNKAWTYRALFGSSVRLPAFRVCDTPDELLAALHELADEGGRAVFKPLDGKGSRGVRVVVPEVNRVTADWREWPAPIAVTWEEVVRDVGEASFPLLAMEYLPGDVREAVDAYCHEGEILCGYARRQRQVVHGLHSYHWVVDDPGLMEQAREAVGLLGLDHFVNLQFKQRKLLEVHPRRSTIIVSDRVNLYWLGLRFALGQVTENDLRAARVEPGWHAKYYFDLYHWRQV